MSPEVPARLAWAHDAVEGPTAYEEPTAQQRRQTGQPSSTTGRTPSSAPSAEAGWSERAAGEHAETAAQTLG